MALRSFNILKSGQWANESTERASCNSRARSRFKGTTRREITSIHYANVFLTVPLDNSALPPTSVGIEYHFDTRDAAEPAENRYFVGRIKEIALVGKGELKNGI